MSIIGEYGVFFFLKITVLFFLLYISVKIELIENLRNSGSVPKSVHTFEDATKILKH